MKKLFTTMFSLALILSLTVLSSCSSGPSSESVKQIIDKYDNDDKLTEADYGVLIDYMSAGIDEAIPLAKDLNKAIEKGDYEKAEKIAEKAEEIEKKYPHMTKVADIFDSGVNEDDLGEANVKKIEKLADKLSEAGLSIYDF